MGPELDRTRPYCRLEPALAVLLVVLKLLVLRGTWGRAQGFDAPHWLAVLRATHWFEPLPLPRALIASYHPPLSYLMGRLALVAVPNEVEASQLLSTLCILGAFLSLRRSLRHIGWLATLPGLILLYGGFSIPLLVWLAIETGYDGPVFFWFMLALAQSIALFWQPTPDKWWRDAKYSFAVTLLGLTLAAGMLTKFNSLIAFGLPFLIVLVRRGIKTWRRDIAASSFAIVVSVIVVTPLYSHRYLSADGHREPAAMDWQRPLDLAAARAARDAVPIRLLTNVLRIPSRSITESQYPVVDSFFNSIWLHTWKRDGCLGLQPEPSLSVSNFYIVVFPFLLVSGTAWFMLRQRRIAEDWRHLGWVLLWVGVVFCASAIAFAWNYPLWDWRVFKGKYITPVVFWVAYATGIAFSDSLLEKWQRAGWKKWVERAVLLVLVAFMLANHGLPVY